MSEYLGLFPKIHDVKFRKHFGLDPLFFVGLKLRPSMGFLHEQGELNQAVIVEKSWENTLHISDISKAESIGL